MININKNSSVEYLNELFGQACFNNRLEDVKYLLKSEELENHAQVNTDSAYGFVWACLLCHMEIIEYLINETDFKDLYDLNIVMTTCIMNNKIKVIDYLLHNTNLKGYIDINTEQIFKVIYETFSNGDKEVMEYFIFQTDMKQTEKINNIPIMKKMFEQKEFKENLEKKLHAVSNRQVSKNKI